MKESEVKESSKSAETGKVSSSKQKRMDREKKASAKKRSAVASNVITWAIVVAFVAAVIALIAVGAVKKSNQVVAKSTSDQFDNKGFVKGVKASNYVSLCDYKNLTIPASELEVTEDEINAQIDEKRELYKESVNADDGVVEDGDTVNIDYVGSIDGVEFEGGNSFGAGYDLVIGSGSFIDDFEQQLIGYAVGDVVNVEVTFPENYGKEDLNGQDALFVVTINGITKEELPEFTDEFVAEKLAAYASTTEEYIQYLKDTGYEEKLTNYIDRFILDDSSVSSVPKKLLKDVKGVTMFADQESYQYMNQMYMQYNGQGFDNLYDYMGMTEEGYMQDLDTRAQNRCESVLVDQAILEAEGITLSADDVKAYVAENYGSEEVYDSYEQDGTLGIVANDAVHAKAREIVKGYAKIQ